MGRMDSTCCRLCWMPLVVGTGMGRAPQWCGVLLALAAPLQPQWGPRSSARLTRPPWGAPAASAGPAAAVPAQGAGGLYGHRPGGPVWREKVRRCYWPIIVIDRCAVL